jgi:hypothetical protein
MPGTDAGMDVAMPADPDLPPSRSRRHRPAGWVSGASTLLAIAALLAVWAVLTAHG